MNSCSKDGGDSWQDQLAGSDALPTRQETHQMGKIDLKTGLYSIGGHLLVAQAGQLVNCEPFVELVADVVVCAIAT